MPKSRRWLSAQDRDKKGRSKKANSNKPARNRKTLIAIGVIAVVAVSISAFFVLGSGLLSGGSSSNTYDWSRYTGSKVRLMTSMGNITLQLRNDKPITTGNFLNLTQLGLYDNTIFHRVIADFMIQGGQITSATIPSIADEIGTDNHNYNSTIAMANTGAANSADSQFFISVADNNNRYEQFDTSYTVFGRVIEGMDVVMRISQVATGTNDKPTQDVTLIKAEVIS